MEDRDVMEPASQRFMMLLPVDLKQWLTERARAENVSVGEYVRRVLALWKESRS